MRGLKPVFWVDSLRQGLIVKLPWGRFLDIWPAVDSASLPTSRLSTPSLILMTYLPMARFPSAS